MEVVEKSTAPARIIRTPGLCGGDPCLDGHRLSVLWYGQLRKIHGDKANAYILSSWDYLREEQVQCMSDFYDANPEWH